MEQSPGHAALRHGRHSQPGRCYLVTTTTAHRVPHFRHFAVASAACAALERSISASQAQLWCWVLMPDHLHLLLQLDHGDALGRTINRVKGDMARAANQVLGRRGHLWSRAFHDRALRHEDDLRAVARYVVGNPLRAGLVTRIGDYPFRSAAWLSADTAAM